MGAVLPRRDVASGLGVLAAAALGAALLLLVPGWFGRPAGAWLLPVAALAALGFDLLVDPEVRAGRPLRVLGTCLALGVLLGGTALLVAAVVRALVVGDSGALGFGAAGAAAALLGAAALRTGALPRP